MKTGLTRVGRENAGAMTAAVLRSTQKSMFVKFVVSTHTYLDVIRVLSEKPPVSADDRTPRIEYIGACCCVCFKMKGLIEQALRGALSAFDAESSVEAC